MKTYYLILSFLAVCVFSHSQDTTFVKIYYQATSNITAEAAIANDVSGFVTCGIRDSEALLLNSDSLGELIWSRTLSLSSSSVSFYDIIATSDSGYIATGNANDWTTGTHQFICVKFDLSGDTIWTRSFQTPTGIGSYETLTRIIESSDSSYVLCWSNPSTSQTMLVKIDANGNIIWEKILEDIYFNSNAIETHEDSAIWMGGNNYPNDGALVKLNSSGDVIWAKSYADRAIFDLKFTDSAIYAAYENNGIGLMKLDTSGSIIWAKKYTLGGWSNIKLTQQFDSTFTLQARADGWQDGVIKVDYDGTIITNGDYRMFISDVVVHPLGGSFILGDGPLYGIREFLQEHIGVIKTDSALISNDCYYNFLGHVASPDSCVVAPVSFTESSGISSVALNFQVNLPDILTDDRCIHITSGLAENKETRVTVFPNTTSGIVHFEFSKAGDYEVWLSTIEGKIVRKTKFSGNKGTMDLSNLSTGIFIYSIANATEMLSGRIIRE